jgi:hypothetical protein
MAVYMVFEPPHDGGDPVRRAERIVFVRDRFVWSAFLLAPVWMLRHRLWLALLGYVVVVGVLMSAMWLSGAGPTWRALALGLIGLLVGFEAANLRRWILLRRGWREAGAVIGDDREAAERRFFDAYAAHAEERTGVVTSPPAPPPPSFRPSAAAADVIGLFPQPGARG